MLESEGGQCLTQVGAISNWNNITIDAGANIRATSIGLTDGGNLTIALGSNVTAGGISGISVINVTGELTEPDTVIVYGLTEDLPEDLVIDVGGVEYTKGIFPGFYEVVGGNLTIHNASSTVLLVNSNYTNGSATELGPKGYTTIANAQAAVTDKATTTIMVYGDDTSVDPGSFTADVVTKDYVTSLVGSADNVVSLDGQSLIVGDSAADVDRKSVV